ncbi:hypothetical protein FGO68_gene7630 [Halteria grandinella]|uniref:Uncharacterized protein n=1 Tax=Halteria grandinella TaxID=5974 RepID=A0A8J8NWK0_HALGN|nr:hypothetical protein FGO68_gene7630 [Halteria grandinella]
MGLKTRQQLIEYLPNLSVTEFSKLGLSESQASAIMRNSNKALQIQCKTSTRIFPRLASKYLQFEIIGYAFVRHEISDLSKLCLNFRQLMIANFQLFKQSLLKAEKKVIRSVFQLLDQRCLSKKYLLCYDKRYQDSYIDETDCSRLLAGRLYFYSIQMNHNQLFMLNLFQPQKVRIHDCDDIAYLFQRLPTSVTWLELTNCKKLRNNPVNRKFKKLRLFNCYYTLDILTKCATATESLTVDTQSLNLPVVLDYLSQLECKQIIIKTASLNNEYLKLFFNRDSKALKFIQFADTFSIISVSSLEKYKWAFKYFTSKSINRVVEISQSDGFKNVRELSNRPFSILQSKSEYIKESIYFDSYVCLPKADITYLAMLAYHTIKGLKVGLICNFAALATEKLILREIIIRVGVDSQYIPQISDIVKKSKDTLRSLTCTGDVDLTPLRNSQELRRLNIEGNTTNANLEVIETFYNLEDLTTNNYSIIEMIKYSKTIKTVSFRDARENLKFPFSVKTVHFQCSSSFKYIQSFLEQNPFIREVSTELMNWHEFAQLLHKFPHIKFNSICYYDHFFNLSNSMVTCILSISNLVANPLNPITFCMDFYTKGSLINTNCLGHILKQQPMNFSLITNNYY